MRKSQKVLADWHNTELFSMRISERPVCYSNVPTWWGQYDVLALLVVPRLPFLSYDLELVLYGIKDITPVLGHLP